MELQGCFTALVTPFTNNTVDFDALNRLVERQIQAGVNGLVPVGTTGESPTLDIDEHKKVIATVVEKAAGRCTVIAGTGANSTAEAVELTKFGRDAGADATLQVTPYYNKPTQEGLYRHFLQVAEEGGLPVVLYHVPSRSARGIDVDTLVRLSEHPGIVAVKEACGDVDRVSDISARCPSLSILSGDDSMTLPRMIVGADGVISVASNLVPGEVARMVQAALEGNWGDAQRAHARLFPLFRDLFIETNPIPIKAAMAMAGLLQEEYRLPLCAMTDEHRKTLEATVRDLGIQG